MLSRRDLLASAGAVVALAAIGGVGTAMAGQGDGKLLRPPGSQSEEHLLGTCIRCDRCRSACPTGAIGVATIEDGLVSMRTPKMEFRKGYCDQCGGEQRCAQVCPVGTIGPFDEETAAIGKAVIDPRTCLTFGISASCPAPCVDACPVGALRIDEDGRLSIDSEPCWGCGACEFACITDSYGVYEGTGSRGVNVIKQGR